MMCLTLESGCDCASIAASPVVMNGAVGGHGDSRDRGGFAAVEKWKCHCATRNQDNRHVQARLELSSPTSQHVAARGARSGRHYFILGRCSEAGKFACAVRSPNKLAASRRPRKRPSPKMTEWIAVSETLGAYFYGADLMHRTEFGAGHSRCRRRFRSSLPACGRPHSDIRSLIREHEHVI